MSRIIKIKSELIEEIDLAQEVITEINQNSLSFDTEQKCFVNQQYNDYAYNTIKKAEKLYYKKIQYRNMQIVEDALKKNGYSTEKMDIKENNSKKIVAVQRVYA